MKVIVGLGNPGKQYSFTRHNIGFIILDHLAQKWNIPIEKSKFRSLVGDGTFNEEKVLLVKPQTYMNLSGEAILEIVQFYKIEPQDIIVVYDDMDLPPGRIRLRSKGGSGGHKGMESIIYLLKSEDFPRLRIGIGKPPPQMDTVGHVLGRFSEDEKECYAGVEEKAVNAIELGIKEGITKAMNTVNL